MRTSTQACYADEWNSLLHFVQYRPKVGSVPKDREWLDREVAALHEAQAELMERYGLLVVRNRGVVEEAVQEAFLRYCEVRKRGHVVDSPKAWLFRVLRNYLIDEYRDERLRSEVALDPQLLLADKGLDPESEMLRIETWRRIEQLTTAKEFECLRLRAVGLSYAEIAELTGVQEGTVASFLNRALTKIRTALHARSKKEPQIHPSCPPVNTAFPVPVIPWKAVRKPDEPS